MDNLKYYNDSLAYDYDMFMPVAKPEPKENIIKLPKTRENKRVRAKAALNTVSDKLFAIIAATIIIGSIIGGIVLRIQMNETNAKINAVKSQINELESEATALNVEFEKRISYANLESEATALGMKKMSNDQVVYITVNTDAVAMDKNGNVIS